MEQWPYLCRYLTKICSFGSNSHLFPDITLEHDFDIYQGEKTLQINQFNLIWYILT